MSARDFFIELLNARVIIFLHISVIYCCSSNNFTISMSMDISCCWFRASSVCTIKLYYWLTKHTYSIKSNANGQDQVTLHLDEQRIIQRISNRNQRKKKHTNKNEEMNLYEMHHSSPSIRKERERKKAVHTFNALILCFIMCGWTSVSGPIV